MALTVVVDSSSDLPENLKTDIVTVPMQVVIDGESYLEGVDIFPETFYKNFRNYKEIPTTSQPSVAEFLTVFEKILQEGKEVVSISLSSGLSSTYQTACMVREMCSDPARVHVIDSLGASLGFGLQALAAEKIVQNKTWAQAETDIIKIRDHMRYIFTLDTLEYLVKGGRVSKTAGFIGGLLNVKPILHVNTGKIEVFDKVRSRKSALHKLIEIMKEETKAPEDQIIGISHSDCLREALALAEDIKTLLKVKEVIISNIGCVVGSHVGPGTIALYYQAG